ncbi:PREDICTED: LOB domain-containing protein 36-like isoform X1 [Lupinus angustifolius]|uniref:LOB domain-containing protein 36-like isoform X1 n=1 Tax=Lupinus angustifolius TaxID=3871 RepID=UPI00092E9808|nr:PREDICTED: LOB domain-containing protein 36-like isoform X1 [Lupinus angustifolius]
MHIIFLLRHNYFSHPSRKSRCISNKPSSHNCNTNITSNSWKGMSVGVWAHLVDSTILLLLRLPASLYKLLNELTAAQRDDAVKSLAYEAEARLRDPVYGCVGLISVLQHRLRQIQMELSNAKKELATYIGPHALQGMPTTATLQHHHLAVAANPFTSSVSPAAHGGPLLLRESQPPQHQILEAQQLGAREHQEMFRGFEHQQQQQQEFLRFNNGGFDLGSVPGSGFSQQVSPDAPVSDDHLSPSLALGSFENPFHHMQQPQQVEHHAHHLPLEAQLLLPPQQEKQVHQQQTQQSQLQHQHHQQQLERDECRSVGPSC